ncbi:hypothetical protein K491DRAFT_577929, partial [Lophiostoma macrostomum CBS 122681]
MTVFVTFTMGPHEAYFFNSPTHWARRNLPPDVESLFTNQPPIKDVLELVLGENGAYFLSFRTPDGQILCRHYNLPNPLITYLYNSQPHVVRDLSTLSITLGSYESYYAYDRNSASWSNLPPTLEKAVLNRLDFQDEQRTVWKERGTQAPCFGLYLFPSAPTSYVLFLASGKAFSNLPEYTWTDYNKMAPHLPATLQTQMPIPPVPQPRSPHPNPPPFQYPSQSVSQPRFQYDPSARPISNGSHQGNYVTPPLQS